MSRVEVGLMGELTVKGADGARSEDIEESS